MPEFAQILTVVIHVT